MNSLTEKRAFLENWAQSAGSVEDLAAAYPDCACEDAEAAAGGYGPVCDDERVRLFITSRGDHDLKRKRKWGPTIFSKIFKSGLSVYRLDRAKSDEIEYAAEILHRSAKERDGEHGGIVGVVDFDCATVRGIKCNGTRVCCVLDTPLEPTESGGFKRPSHADVVHATGNVPNEQKQALRIKIYNAVKAAENYTDAGAVTDCDLKRFVPDAIAG